MERLSLASALASGRLDDFVAQAEADGIGPAGLGQFDILVFEASKERPQEDRTSRSRGPGSSRGK